MTWMVHIHKALMQEMWKKSTIALNAHILSELAPNLWKIICWEDEICPLWQPLSLQLSTLMTWMVQIRKALMQEMWKKSTIALIAHRLSDLVPHLCQIISQRGEICPLWRPLTQSLAMLMTWMVQIRELLMQEMWKKSTIALNAHILSELAPNLCKIICWEDEICPLWRPLSLWLSMLMTWIVHICKVLMQEMWKN